MKAAIQKHLKQSPEEYDLMILSIWNSWWGEKTSSAQSHQKAMCNRTLFNWWRAQMDRYEQEFLGYMKDYPEADAKTARMFYAEIIIPVFKFYARPMMPKSKPKPKPFKPL